MIEKNIAYHCGPALAGIKPSNLTVVQKTKHPDAKDEINKLNEQLNSKDIYIEVLYECNTRLLIFLYRRKLLNETINKEDTKALLYSFGYTHNLDDSVKKLKTRIQDNAFPHEIGAFLGYPTKDIYGFIYNKGEKSLLTGEWKVYDNVEYAKKQFKRYETCRKAIVRRIENGDTLAKIFRAAYNWDHYYQQDDLFNKLKNMSSDISNIRLCSL